MQVAGKENAATMRVVRKIQHVNYLVYRQQRIAHLLCTLLSSTWLKTIIYKSHAGRKTKRITLLKLGSILTFSYYMCICLNIMSVCKCVATFPILLYLYLSGIFLFSVLKQR